MSEVDILIKAVKDFFSKPILKIALYPFFVTLIVMYAIFFVVADIGLDSVQSHILEVQQHKIAVENGEITQTQITTQRYFGKDVIEFLLQYSITSWIVALLVYALGTIFVLFFALFITLIVVGFLTPWILTIIQKRHYKTLEFRGHGTLAATFFVLIKSILVMLLLFVLLTPLYFIPVLNIFIINIPFYYFFYTLLNFDITSTIMSKEEEAIIKVKSKGAFHIRTIMLYLISMIPFVVLFTTVFYVVYLGHNYMREVEKLRQ